MSLLRRSPNSQVVTLSPPIRTDVGLLSYPTNNTSMRMPAGRAWRHHIYFEHKRITIEVTTRKNDQLIGIPVRHTIFRFGRWPEQLRLPRATSSEYLDGGFGANNSCEEIHEEVRTMNNHAETCTSIILSVSIGRLRICVESGKPLGYHATSTSSMSQSNALRNLKIHISGWPDGRATKETLP